MEKVCSTCAMRGTVDPVPGKPNAPEPCLNSRSPKFGEPVGYHGTGCESWVAPSRFGIETIL